MYEGHTILEWFIVSMRSFRQDQTDAWVKSDKSDLHQKDPPKDDNIKKTWKKVWNSIEFYRHIYRHI